MVYDPNSKISLFLGFRAVLLGPGKIQFLSYSQPDFEFGNQCDTRAPSLSLKLWIVGGIRRAYSLLEKFGRFFWIVLYFTHDSNAKLYAMKMVKNLVTKSPQSVSSQKWYTATVYCIYKKKMSTSAHPLKECEYSRHFL